MAGIVKTMIRVGVIGGLVAGGAILVAGPHRAMALYQQLHSKVVGVIDSSIEDPVALRAQLRELEAQYPQRIAEARSQMADIEEQIRQVEREKRVSERVVDLASADLTNIQSLIARAEQKRGEDPMVLVSIRWDDRKVSMDQAYAKANYIAAAAKSYRARTEDAQRSLASLRHEKEQVDALLTQLEQEQMQFQAQLFQLDGQIDAVARKERIVSLMEQRQRRLDQLSRYQVASLDQFRARLAKKHAALDAKIEMFSKGDAATNYEHQAEFQVDTETSAAIRGEFEAKPSSVEINSDGGCAGDETKASGAKVFASKPASVVIE